MYIYIFSNGVKYTIIMLIFQYISVKYKLNGACIFLEKRRSEKNEKPFQQENCVGSGYHGITHRSLSYAGIRGRERIYP